MTAYDSIMNYTLTHYKEKGGGGTNDIVSDLANYNKYAEYVDLTYNFDDEFITIEQHWRPLGNTVEEYINNLYTGNTDKYFTTGAVSEFRMSESCGLNNPENYYPVSIHCRWIPTEGGWDLTLSLSKDNIIKVNLFGDNKSHYWMHYKLESSDHIIELFNNAREKLAKLEKKEYIPLVPIENIKATVLSSFENETYWYNEEQKIVDKNQYRYIVKEGKIGLADKYGEIKISPIYSRLELSDDGKYAIVKKDELQGVMKIDSTVVEEILPVKYSYIAPLEWNNLGKGDPIGIYFSENDPYVYTIKNEKAGVYDKHGNCICDNKYEKISYNDYLFCGMSNGLDIINPETKNLVHIDCDDYIPSADSYCIIKKNGKWGVINKEGNLVIDTIYDEILLLPEYDLFTLTDQNTDIVVVKDGKYGVIDLNGKIMVPTEYDYIAEHNTFERYNFKTIFKGNYDKENRTFDGIWKIYKDGQIMEGNEFATEEDAINYFNSIKSEYDNSSNENPEESESLGVEIMDSDEEIKEEAKDEIVEEEAIPFQLVEEKPTFNGGDANEFSKWVNANLQYPEIAKENGVQGRVTLEFTVNQDGSVSNVKVLRGVESSLDKEAVRVVSMSPKWKPGKQRNRAVKVIYTFPVVFQLR